jgi:cellulose synthase/poly-beta-1,6-N-acetylglucosamine synthase-like glycosyltransferase
LSAPRFSVIIPAHRDGPAFRRCVAACAEQDYDDFEVIVATDRGLAGLPEGVRMVKTGSAVDTSPAEKRDAAFAAASGDVLAYVDDDAYPAPDWLRTAARRLAEDSVKALGGPGLTPPESPWRERVGGAVYESPAGSGPLRYRFVQAPQRTVEDYPAYNLFVRREALEAVGGWGTSFYGGEDTVLCLKLARAGWPILYAPEVIAYHRRRPVVLPHLRQVANVGRHRGYFVRAYADTSRRAIYVLPSLGPAALGLAFLLARRRPLVGLPLLAAGYLAIAAEARRRHPLSVAAAVPLMAAAHHLAYGAAFVRGFLSQRLDR